MGTYEFKVNIQAGSEKEAENILNALIDIKIAMSANDLLMFAGAIKKKPHLIRKAKIFLR